MLYMKFDKFTTKLLNSITFTIFILIIGFVLSCFSLYNIMDFKYASDKDYEPLLTTQEAIVKDFDTVYTYSNTDIAIKDENIIVYIYGDDCYLKTYFNKDKIYQNTQKIDNTDPVWITTSTLLLASVLGAGLFYILYLVAILLLVYLVLKISKKFSKE